MNNDTVMMLKKKNKCKINSFSKCSHISSYPHFIFPSNDPSAGLS